MRLSYGYFGTRKCELESVRIRRNLTKRTSMFIEFNIEYSFVNLVFC
jgi:hypothetical protein